MSLVQPLAAQRRHIALSLAALAVLATTHSAWAADEAEETRRLVEQAREAFDTVADTPGYESLREGLKGAHGVLIFPSLVRGGLVVGATGGTGVLLARGAGSRGDGTETGWSSPAFYTLGGLNVGLLAGGETAQVVVLVNSQAALERLLSNSVKLGAEASVALGAGGKGRAANIRADFITYARTRGAYAGLSLEGSVLDVRRTLNRAYYGQAVGVSDILIQRTVAQPHADALREAVARRSGG